MPLHAWEIGSILFAMKLFHHSSQITQVMSILTVSIIALPGPLTFHATTSFCQLLWTLSASAPKYLLVFKKKTYCLSPSCLLPCQVSNSYSQLLVPMQLHLSSPLPKKTILERRQAKGQWLRQLSSIIRASDTAYKIFQCMKKTSFVSVVD